MCTAQCRRPGALGLSPSVTGLLDDLFHHPIVRLLAEQFAEAGGGLFVVGGPVRDALRGIADFSDLDFTTDLRPAQTKRVLDPLGTLWTAGEERGTIAVHAHVGKVSQKVEVTTFRTETYHPGSRKPTVGFGDRIVDDLRRRDLSVNAIAMNVAYGCLLDPFDGLTALDMGVLDTPDDPDTTLSEDPLRILRAIRFAARLDAVMAPRLAAAAQRNHDRLSIVSAERKLDELTKLATLGQAALAAGLAQAEQLGVLPHWLPSATASTASLGTLVSLDGPETGHGPLVEALAVLHHGLGDSALDRAMRALKVPTAQAKQVAALAGVRRAVVAGSGAVAEARSLLRSHDDRTLSSASRVHQALTGAPHPTFAQAAAVVADEPDVRGPLPVDGRDLLDVGLRGRHVGDALRLLEQQFCHAGRLRRDEALELAHARADRCAAAFTARRS